MIILQRRFILYLFFGHDFSAFCRDAHLHVIPQVHQPAFSRQASMPCTPDHRVDFAFQRVVRVGNSDILVLGCPIVSILFVSIQPI